MVACVGVEAWGRSRRGGVCRRGGVEAWRRGGVEARRRGCVCRRGGVEAGRRVIACVGVNA